MEDELKKRCADVLTEVGDIISQMDEFRNEQWVLDFCDKLNHYSVQY